MGKFEYVDGLGWVERDDIADPEPPAVSDDTLPPYRLGESARPEPAATAGQQDHTDPWVYAGQPCDPPSDTGRPADD